MTRKLHDRTDGNADDVEVDDKPFSKAKIALGVAVLLGLTGLYWGLSEAGLVSTLADKQALRAWINQLGSWGPLAIILMMIAAIVMSPIPSGPIAIVAGAAYGPVWGTVWAVMGAEGGALIAFWLARYLGYGTVRRWARMRPLLRRLEQHRSQRKLMVIVFVSRLVPFISFDAVSYAAGLTPLAFWRFAIATLAGVIPVAFLFTYFGEALINVESTGMTIFLLLLSSVTLIPIAARWLWNRYQKRKT